MVVESPASGTGGDGRFDANCVEPAGPRAPGPAVGRG